MCTMANFNPGGHVLGCAIRTKKSCLVIYAPDEEIIRFGLSFDIIHRHEIAHCNGWPGDHRGVLPFEVEPEHWLSHPMKEAIERELEKRRTGRE